MVGTHEMSSQFILAVNTSGESQSTSFTLSVHIAFDGSQHAPVTAHVTAQHGEPCVQTIGEEQEAAVTLSVQVAPLQQAPRAVEPDKVHK